MYKTWVSYLYMPNLPKLSHKICKYSELKEKLKPQILLVPIILGKGCGHLEDQPHTDYLPSFPASSLYSPKWGPWTQASRGQGLDQERKLEKDGVGMSQVQSLLSQPVSYGYNKAQHFRMSDIWLTALETEGMTMTSGKGLLLCHPLAEGLKARRGDGTGNLSVSVVH